MKKYLLLILCAPLGLYAHAEGDQIELQDARAQKIAVEQLLAYRNADSERQMPANREYDLSMFILGKDEHDPKIFDEVEQPHAKVLPVNDSKPIRKPVE